MIGGMRKRKCGNGMKWNVSGFSFSKKKCFFVYIPELYALFLQCVMILSDRMDCLHAMSLFSQLWSFCNFTCEFIWGFFRGVEWISANLCSFSYCQGRGVFFAEGISTVWACMRRYISRINCGNLMFC